MKQSLSPLRIAALSLALSAGAPLAFGQTFWSGGAGVNTNWSAAANWSSGFVPGAFDAVIFIDSGAVIAASNINNAVDGGAFGGSLATLQYGNTNGFHTTLIPAGQTLTIGGALTVGTETDNGVQTVFTTITGPGGALVMNNSSGNLIVRQASSTSGAGLRATLDLSGLDTFTATVGRCLIGSEAGKERPCGTLTLAKTNSITASGSSPALSVGGRGGNNNSGNASFVNLGQTNVLFVGSISVGRGKQTGSTFRFNTNGMVNPVAYIRAADGSSRVATWNVADSEGISGTVNTGGTVDLTGGIVDGQVDSMTIARTSTGSGTGNPSGTFSFGAGTLDVNTLQIGYQNSGSVSANFANGTFRLIGPGKLVVNSGIELGHISAGGNITNRGTLSISNGTVLANAIICGLGTNTITLTNGTLVASNGIGSASAGLFSLSLSNSTLQVPALNNTAAVVLTNLVTGGTTNKINLGSIAPVTGYPAQFTLIQYAGTIGGAGYNFGTGTFPPSPNIPYGGYVSNDGAHNAVVLVLTNGAIPSKELTWNGNISGDWDVSTTLNWLSNSIHEPYNQNDFVTFDDSASGTTTINLTTQLLPAGLLVNNTNKTYTFTGSGYLSGSFGGLVKQGPGTLIIDNGGANDFTGGLIINGGTVQIGNNDFNARLPATGTIVDNAVLAFNQQGDLTVPNVIAGTGAVTTASGILRLAGANTFTDAVTVVSGTLVPANNSALGSTTGPTIVNSGATLDVEAGTANSLNLNVEPIIVSGAGVGGNGAIVNNGATAQQNALRVVTLAGNTAFGGVSRWDIRGTGATLMSGGNPWKITKTGFNQVSLVGVNPIDSTLGDIDIQQGIFAVQTTTTQLGDPNKTITVEGGATLNVYNLTAAPLNKQIALNGNGDGITSSIDAENGNSTISGPVTLNGPCIIGVRGTSLTLNDTVTGTGSLFKNGSGTLILAGVSSPAGGVTNSLGTLVLNGSNSVPLWSLNGATLAGSGTNTATVQVQGLLNPGPTNGPGTFTATAGLALQLGSSLGFDLGTNNTIDGTINDLIQITGDLDATNAPVTINAYAGRLQAGTYRLINYSGNLFADPFGAFFPPQGSPSTSTRYGFSLDTSTAGQVNLTVTGSSVDLKWASTFDTSWSPNGSYNWINLATSSSDAFQNGDTVLLDDSVGGVTNTLNIGSGVAVLPWAITNNSALNNYTIMGAGKISGVTGLLKNGTSTLTITTTNDFTGPVNVLAGTLKVGASSALGATNSGTTIASGATLDVGGTNMAANVLNLGFEMVTVSGAGVNAGGAIINSSTNNQQNALRMVTLAGHTSFGGPGNWMASGNPGRWDIRSQAANTDIAASTNAVLSTDGQPYDLTKVGTNQVSIVGVLVDPALANINVLGGALSIEHSSTMGDASKTITVANGATLQFWQNWPSNLLSKKMVLYGDGVSTNVNNPSGSNIFVGPVTLNSGLLSNTNCVFNVVGSPSTLTFSNNTVGGSAGLTKIGAGLLILYDANTYSGSTFVNAGTLALAGSSALSATPAITIAAGATVDVSARSDSTLTLTGTQLLAGNGAINGTLTAGAGTTVSPGSGGVGALTVTNAVVLQGTTSMDLDPAHNTNDVIRGAFSINYGGTLNLVFTPGTLQNNNSFKLFSAGAGGYTGSFALQPAQPGLGLQWDTSLLNSSGTLRVAVLPQPGVSSVTLSSGNLVISGTNGTTGLNYAVLESTNVALPFNQWLRLTTNVFGAGGTFTFTISVDPSAPQKFYAFQAL